MQHESPISQKNRGLGCVALKEDRSKTFSLIFLMSHAARALRVRAKICAALSCSPFLPFPTLL